MKVAGGRLSREDAHSAFELLDALRESRFRFAAEPWHDAHERNGIQNYPAEMLLRARTEADQPIKPLKPITIISNMGLQGAFDKALILAAVDQGLQEGLMPISINTSARNMNSAEFWNDISKMLRENFTPEEIKNNLTFEVTEDDLADNPCREILSQMIEEFGCTFAIDDFYHDRAYHIEHNSGFDSDDWKRLENLKGIISYVKIDGETVEATLDSDNPFNLAALIDKIKTYVPQAQIVLERIKDADQAFAVSGYGDAVQGWDLPNDRADFKDELEMAAHNFPPCPKHIKPKMKK